MCVLYFHLQYLVLMLKALGFLKKEGVSKAKVYQFNKKTIKKQ